MNVCVCVRFANRRVCAYVRSRTLRTNFTMKYKHTLRDCENESAMSIKCNSQLFSFRHNDLLISNSMRIFGVCFVSLYSVFSFLFCFICCSLSLFHSTSFHSIYRYYLLYFRFLLLCCALCTVFVCVCVFVCVTLVSNT